MQIIEEKVEFRESLLSWYNKREKRFAMEENVQSILHMGIRSDVTTDTSRHR